jgi:two-component system, NarL family, response regulator
MDLRMPEMNGVEAIISIRQEFPTAQIAILTTYDTDEDIFRGLQAGAKGYLLKDSKMVELIDAIRTLHNGQRYIPPAVGAKLAERITLPQLSDREMEVLGLMATGKANQDICAELCISESTVKFHINNIFSKLEVSDRTQAIIVAIKWRYRRSKFLVVKDGIASARVTQVFRSPTGIVRQGDSPKEQLNRRKRRLNGERNFG